MTGDRARRAAIWMVMAQVLFALMNVSARAASAGASWQLVGASRFVLGAATAWTIARLRGVTVCVRSGRAAWLRTGFGTASAALMFFTLGARGMALGDVATLFATTPLMIALLAGPLLDERVGGRVVLATVLAFTGLVALAQPSFTSAPSLIASGLGSAMCSALAMIALRRIGDDEPPEAIVFHFSSFGALVFIAASIPGWRWPDAHGALLLVATGISGGAAQLCMTRAYAIDAAARVSALSYFGALFTRALAAIAFHERPDVAQLAGTILIFAAGAMLARSERALERRTTNAEPRLRGPGVS